VERHEAEHHFGGVDPGPIVLDEVVGMLITLALLEVNAMGAFVGFIVFRALDVVKPWPSGRFERLHGGSASWPTTRWRRSMATS
jgi:phosphatidylglycerophosphatase A